jgi:two-component system, OmpR family, alkaline phosphatase synthesis response regulator PhoP
MAKGTILIVEDEKDIRELLRHNLEREQYRVLVAESGEEGLKLARRDRPDLVLLDLMLPGMDGLEVCRSLRSDVQTRRIPIVMLTARSEDADVVAGLELGADDYVTKPFQPRVLLARLRSVLRRSEAERDEPGEVIARGDLQIDTARHEVHVRGKSVALTLTEFRILAHLARQPGRVFSRYQILDGIQGQDAFVLDRTIDVHVAALRRKLGAPGDSIETVRGVGYRWKDA